MPSFKSPALGHRLDHEPLLLKEVPVDLKLLLQHDFPPVLNDQRVHLQITGGTKDLPMLLDASDSPQLQLRDRAREEVAQFKMKMGCAEEAPPTISAKKTIKSKTH